jgi:hypothetical protein
MSNTKIKTDINKVLKAIDEQMTTFGEIDLEPIDGDNSSALDAFQILKDALEELANDAENFVSDEE